jgi:hypothetical protein
MGNDPIITKEAGLNVPEELPEEIRKKSRSLIVTNTACN